jgi:hypothetical protein
MSNRLRRTWVVLLLLGAVPAALFFVLKWTGRTDALHHIATTRWMPGDPSAFDLVCLFLSVFTWAWVKGFMNFFFFAAVPFALADAVRARRGRKEVSP